MNEFNNVISQIKRELEPLSISMASSNSMNEKIFTITEMEEDFSINYDDYTYGYKFIDTQWSKPNDNIEEFISSVDRDIKRKYEAFLYKNSNQYIRFTNKIELIIGKSIKKTFDEYQVVSLINNEFLMLEIPIKPLYCIYKDDNSGCPMYHTYKTQKELFNTLEAIYQD